MKFISFLALFLGLSFNGIEAQTFHLEQVVDDLGSSPLRGLPLGLTFSQLNGQGDLVNTIHGEELVSQSLAKSYERNGNPVDGFIVNFTRQVTATTLILKNLANASQWRGIHFKYLAPTTGNALENGQIIGFNPPTSLVPPRELLSTTFSSSNYFGITQGSLFVDIGRATEFRNAVIVPDFSLRQTDGSPAGFIDIFVPVDRHLQIVGWIHDEEVVKNGYAPINVLTWQRFRLREGGERELDRNCATNIEDRFVVIYTRIDNENKPILGSDAFFKIYQLKQNGSLTNPTKLAFKATTPVTLNGGCQLSYGMVVLEKGEFGFESPHLLVAQNFREPNVVGYLTRFGVYDLTTGKFVKYLDLGASPPINMTWVIRKSFDRGANGEAIPALYFTAECYGQTGMVWKLVQD